MAPDQEARQAEVLITLWSLFFALRELLIRSGAINRRDLVAIWKGLPSRLASGECPELEALINELNGSPVDPKTIDVKQLQKLFTGEQTTH